MALESGFLSSGSVRVRPRRTTIDAVGASMATWQSTAASDVAGVALFASLRNEASRDHDGDSPLTHRWPDRRFAGGKLRASRWRRPDRAGVRKAEASKSTTLRASGRCSSATAWLRG